MTPLSAEDCRGFGGPLRACSQNAREVGKALEDLKANKPNDARKHLETAQKAAPTSAEIATSLGFTPLR